MGLNCGCPAGAAIASITAEACSESLGQIQKVIFQRIYSAGTTKNEFVVATTNPNLKATWTPLFAAVAGTKTTISPYIQGPTNEVGAARKFGGGNATLGGIEVIIGREPSKFTCNLYSIRQATTIKDMKDLMCEKLGVFLIDENGRIAGIGNAATPTIISPIPIHSLFIGDKKLGGVEEPDSNTMEFSLMPNWSDNLAIVTPIDFSPLTDF
jgi:hypothetical protein